MGARSLARLFVVLLCMTKSCVACSPHTDKLVAEYLLLHLLSSVQVRLSDQTIGHLALNITGLPATEAKGATGKKAPEPEALKPATPVWSTASAAARRFAGAYEQLTPRSTLFPMTRANMCHVPLQPKKVCLSVCLPFAAECRVAHNMTAMVAPRMKPPIG